MSGGNGFYDGETEAVPLALAETGTIEPLEGLEEPLDVAGIDNGAGVGDRQVSQAVPGAGLYPSRRACCGSKRCARGWLPAFPPGAGALTLATSSAKSKGLER